MKFSLLHNIITYHNITRSYRIEESNFLIFVINQNSSDIIRKKKKEKIKKNDDK